MNFKKLKSHKTFEGQTIFAEHESSSTKTNMKFSYFMPKGEKPDHAIIWLSGLTCNEENFITKAGAQKILANKNAMIICPDTSPRGLDLPNEHKDYDFGSGAGFYLNATTNGYKDHYNMYDYIIKELVPVVKSFGVSKISITGHSMGGHGALVMGLREPQIFNKVSAFSPITNPTNCPWGQKAFTGYLGDDKSLWNEYDACSLILNGKKRNDSILIEQGTDDNFYKEKQLLTENLEKACAESSQSLKVKYREGYDHSYYFISTFIDDHINFLIS